MVRRTSGRVATPSRSAQPDLCLDRWSAQSGNRPLAASPHFPDGRVPSSWPEGHLKQLQGKRPTVAEKYDYLYSEKELEGIARAAGALNGKAERVHLAMNNNNRDYPVINGLKLKEMLLEDWHAPDREALIEELDDRRSKVRTSRPRRRPAA